MAGKNEDAWTRSASGKLAGWGSVRRTRGKKIDRKRVEKEGRRKNEDVVVAVFVFSTRSPVYRCLVT